MDSEKGDEGVEVVPGRAGSRQLDSTAVYAISPYGADCSSHTSTSTADRGKGVANLHEAPRQAEF
jgi:hypothetical protein